MLRMTASLSACFAILGRYSQTWIPGTLVPIGRKGPEMARPIFMSNVSRWLAPPAIQRRMHFLPCFFASWAIVSELNSEPQFPTARPPAPTIVPFRNARRETCSEPPHSQGFTVRPPLVVEAELAAVYEDPDRLFEGRLRLRRPLQVGDELLLLRSARQAPQHREEHPVDLRLPRIGAREDLVGEVALPALDQLLDLPAVVHEEALRDAPLEFASAVGHAAHVADEVLGERPGDRRFPVGRRRVGAGRGPQRGHHLLGRQRT